MRGETALTAALERALEKKLDRIRLAMESVLIEMVNFVKENGPWTDRTSNLRNSISYKSPERISDGVIRGTVYAGMEYAIHVEYREGYWVLSGAMIEFHDVFLQMIRERARL